MAIKGRFDEYPDRLAKYVRPTEMVDSDMGYVRKQANELTKECNNALEAIKALHSFVAGFPIGYDDERSKASEVMLKKRGQCNTKTTLLIALCRVLRIPTRLHAWRVHKKVHKHHMHWLVYLGTPSKTLFTYPEVYFDGEWRLLSEILTKKPSPDWEKCPFDNASKRNHPLKKEWIAEDLGSFWHPDIFYRKYGTNHDGWRSLFFPLAKLLLNNRN